MYIIIVGCGRSGSLLATMLSEEGHDVVIIDKDKRAFQRLGPLFNGLTYESSGSDLESLEEAGIKKAQALALMTNSDTSNAMIAQIAKKIYHLKWVVAKIYDPELSDSLKDLGFEILSPTILISKLIRDRFVHGFLRSYFQEVEDRLEVVEITAHEKIIGHKYQDLIIPGVFSVITCKNQAGCIIPKPDMIVRKHDIILGIFNHSRKSELKDILGPSFFKKEE